MAKVAKSSGRGSKPGERRGGRKKGTRNRKTAETIKVIEETGVTPLQFMLDVMRGKAPDGSGPAEIIAFTTLRFEAAKAAAPYVHPKLAAIEHTGKGGGPIQSESTVTVTPDEAYKRMLGGV
jgi:hypothetical protein